MSGEDIISDCFNKVEGNKEFGRWKKKLGFCKIRLVHIARAEPHNCGVS